MIKDIINNIYVSVENILIMFEVLVQELFVLDCVLLVIYDFCQIIVDIIYCCDYCMLVICGLCFIYDIEVVKDYVLCLKELYECYKDILYIVMCVYFEKFCIMIGWKGLINDLYINDIFDIEMGFCKVCELLIWFVELELFVVIEVLDFISLQYLVELFSWSVIGVCIFEL